MELKTAGAVSLLGVFLTIGSAVAQETANAAWPAADPADVSTIDAIMASVYDVISGAAGEQRDWDRFRSLFVPEGRLIPVGVGPDGKVGKFVMSVEDYAERADGWFAGTGFYEIESHRVTEQYGHIAHVFSTYESRRSADDAEPFMRGINSFQLMNDGERWWVVSIFWEAEAPNRPIPEEYLDDGI